MKTDSVDKIVSSYFAPLTKREFVYKGIRHVPKPVTISPLLLRGYTCPENCGACCLKFSLDYLPGEQHPPNLKPRYVEFDEERILVYSDLQTENESRSCKHLDQTDGRCSIHGFHPFTCDFELIRTLSFEQEQRPSILTAKLYGRGWNMLRVDGERGARCEMTEPTTETRDDVLRKLARLKEWADHFRVLTWLPEIMTIISHHDPLPVTLSRPEGKGLFR